MTDSSAAEQTELNENIIEKKPDDTPNLIEQEISTLDSQASKGETPAPTNTQSPAPVAPPRKKRQQKKDALTKDSSAPPKPPPPRPKNPPVIIKELAAKADPVEEPSTQLANQPCIMVNSNTTDMNQLLMKGSANEIVKNQDLDEYKSPTGSKVRLSKEEEGKVTLLNLQLNSFELQDLPKEHNFANFFIRHSTESKVLDNDQKPRKSKWL